MRRRRVHHFDKRDWVAGWEKLIVPSRYQSLEALRDFLIREGYLCRHDGQSALKRAFRRRLVRMGEDGTYLWSVSRYKVLIALYRCRSDARAAQPKPNPPRDRNWLSMRKLKRKNRSERHQSSCRALRQFMRDENLIGEKGVTDLALRHGYARLNQDGEAEWNVTRVKELMHVSARRLKEAKDQLGDFF